MQTYPVVAMSFLPDELPLSLDTALSLPVALATSVADCPTDTVRPSRSHQEDHLSVYAMAALPEQDDDDFCPADSASFIANASLVV